MSDSVPSLPSAAGESTWDPDVVFPLIADPSRRRTLLAIVRGGAQPACLLRSASGKLRSATSKHLIALRKAGIVTARPDPSDARRTLYGLSPKVTVVKSGADSVALDFGCCVVRL